MVNTETVAIIGGAVVAGTAAVCAAPLVLSAVGFTAAGVAAGSIAAAIQTPVTVAGGWFALAQSAGAVGLGVGANVGIFSTVAAATSGLTAGIRNIVKRRKTEPGDSDEGDDHSDDNKDDPDKGGEAALQHGAKEGFYSAVSSRAEHID